MDIQTIRLSILSIALIWATPISAQPEVHDLPNETTLDNLFSLSERFRIDRATIAKKVIWAGISLINPEDKYKIFPLFGYPVSTFREQVNEGNISLNNVLSEVMADNIRLAVLTTSDDDVHEGQGVRIVGEIDDNNLSAVQSQFDQLLATLQADNEGEPFGNDGSSEYLIAFTLPLRAIEAQEEFVAGSKLWALTQHDVRTTSQ